MAEAIAPVIYFANGNLSAAVPLKSSSSVMPKRSASAGRSITSGHAISLSHFDTACAVTPSLEPRASCVSPVFFLSLAMLSPSLKYCGIYSPVLSGTPTRVRSDKLPRFIQVGVRLTRVRRTPVGCHVICNPEGKLPVAAEAGDLTSDMIQYVHIIRLLSNGFRVFQLSR